MTLLNLWVENGIATALGRALVHSLWEGLVVAIALAAVLALAHSSRVRCVAACVAMIAVVLSFGVTIYSLMPQSLSHRVAFNAAPAAAISPGDSARVPAVPASWDEQSFLRWLAPLWIAGVFLFQMRFVGAWIMASRLRRTGVCRPAAEWLEKLDHLRARLRVAKTVTLLESCLAEVPVVIGHLRPVILVPIDLLANLPVGQMESILLHELAHIRRADYLINLMQTVVEGLMFYHPAVWWISGVIRAERENCCDDLVVQTNGNAHEYANALAALERNRFAAREVAMAASGGSLTQRIRRLLSEPAAPRAMIAPLVPLGILIAACAATLMAWPQPALRIVPSIKAVHAPLLFAQTQAAVSPYKKWFDDVTYIITDQERRDFKNLKTDRERDQFIEQFWAKRNPVPGSATNDYKKEHYRRLDYVNDRYSTKSLAGWKTDRGRIYITYGPPDEIDAHPSRGAYEEGGVSKPTYPFEQWRYRHIDGIGDNIILEFVDHDRNGEYKMTMDPNEKVAALNDVIEAAAARETAEPQFEVASVKPSAPGSIGPTIYNPTRERFAIESITTKSLIAYAYDVRDFQVSGGPEWFDSDEYSIVAKPQGGASNERVLAMTRGLLAERFNLKLHHEPKEMPVLTLTVAHGGPKLHPSAGTNGPEVRGGRGHLVARNVTMGLLAAQLANRVLDRPVLDRTGVAGEFDINLEWTPDDRPDHGPSVFTALEEQLGLKLVSQKGVVDILVVDHVEKPSAN